MEQTNQQVKSRKLVTVAVIVGVVILFAGVLMSYNVPTIEVADADEIASLKAQIELLNKTANFHQSVLQQHDTQIHQIANNTNIIAQWAEDFSHNTNQRLDTLEKQE